MEETKEQQSLHRFLQFGKGIGYRKKDRRVSNPEGKFYLFVYCLFLDSVGCPDYGQA